MKTNRSILSVLIAALIGGLASAQSGGNFVIKDATLEGAGHKSSGGAFVSDVRLGQGLVGQSSGGVFAVGGGVFPEPPQPPPVTPPAAPNGLTAAADSASAITLEWQGISDNEKGFLIERCQKGKMCTNFVEIAEVGENITTFQDSGLSKNTQYRYRVRAFNTAGNSAYSNIASAKTLRR